MKTYKIGIWEEKSGYIEIKAENEQEAKQRVLLMVEDNGLDHDADTYDGYYEKHDVESVDITHRDVHLI